MTQPGFVAQLVERRCSNPEVVGSNPAGVKDFSFILVLISNFLLLRPVVGGKLAVFMLETLISSKTLLSSRDDIITSSIKTEYKSDDFTV